MQALRSARVPVAALRATSARRLATTAGTLPHAAASTAASSGSVVPLSNVEAQWEKLSVEDQAQVYAQLEELQKKDWKQLSLDEKKAAYYVSFGPHGPRAPTNPPGTVPKILFGTGALIGSAALLYYLARSAAPPPPRTLTPEWEEAANQRAKEANINPLHGISSEGYSGKGFKTR